MKFRFLIKEKISQLPKTPGVYTFKNEGAILYIGKATNIQERVKNHFKQPGYKDYLFLDKVGRIGFIKTNSEIEALILEAELIKKYQPKYNVIWRDDKNYFFVGITKEDFPRIFWTHQREIKNAPRTETKFLVRGQKSPKESLRLPTGRAKIKNEFIGPFVDGTALKQTLKILRKVFPYRSCQALPTRKAGTRPCLWYHLLRCPAPCLLKTPLASQIPNAIPKMKKECQRNAKNLIKILQGKKKQVLKDLKKEMKKAATFQDFERAAKIRDQIGALERVISHAKIFELQALPKEDWLRSQKILQQILKIKRGISRIEAYDISNIQGQEATGSMVTFIKGSPDKNFYRRFKIKIPGKPDDIAMIKEIFFRRFSHSEWGWPDLILIDGGKAQLNAARQCLNSKFRDIKVIALAKKRNELFIESQKNPILLKNLPREIFNLILQLRDEAHRFAITYHKKLRVKALIGE